MRNRFFFENGCVLLLLVSSFRLQFIGVTWVVLLALFGQILFVRMAYSQISRASLNGTVTDASGAVVPNARVEIIAPATGFKMGAVTGNAGVYSLNDLPIGNYDLTVSADGFKTFVTKGIKLSVGETRTLNAQLEVGVTATTVEVQDTA